jgi:hypothetical protein
MNGSVQFHDWPARSPAGRRSIAPSMPATPAAICSVPRCRHPVQRAGGSYCVSHAGLIYRFARWLDGDTSYDVLSFDRDRAGLEHGTWHPV